VAEASARAGAPVPTTLSEPSLGRLEADASADAVVAQLTDILWG
jgi:hypothetical protein